MDERLKLSEEIETILYFFERCKQDYKWHESQYQVEENKENELRHEIEGVGVRFRSPPLHDDRSKLATALQKALIARRISKDLIAIHKPVIDFIDSEIGKNAINQLKQKLGDVRKLEKNSANRIFYKRKTENDTPETESTKVNKANLDKMIRDWKRKSKSKY